MTTKDGNLVPSKALRECFGGVTVPTIARWVERRLLPPPLKINGRHYWPESVLAQLRAGGIGSVRFDDSGRAVEAAHE